jgi:nuclease-like protein
VSYHVDSTPGTYSPSRESTVSVRSILLIAAFAGVGVLPLVLARAFGVSFAVSAPIVVLLAVIYWAAESDSLLMERGLKGRNGEAVVGEALEGLRWERYIVLHDIPFAGEGNIDHLVSGPNGVYLVETKFGSYLPVHLKKAKRQAAKLSDDLGVLVTPVLCVGSKEADPYRHGGVQVVGFDALLPWIREQTNPPVEFERLARFSAGV